MLIISDATPYLNRCQCVKYRFTIIIHTFGYVVALDLSTKSKFINEVGIKVT